MERVLPTRDVKELMAGLAVGLAADCDNPESDVEKIFRAKLPGQGTLPFVGFVTHDGEWVAGFGGYKQPNEFLKIAREADDSPLLKASPAVQKKLAGLAEKAQKALEKEDWRNVLKAGQDAAKTTGRCPERKQLEAIVGKARAWAQSQFDAATRLAQQGGELDEARKLIQTVKNRFAKEPEQDVAEAGLKALRLVERIRKAEADGKDTAVMRADAKKEFAETRWTTMFDKSEAAPAADESAPDEEKPDEGESEIEGADG